MVSSFPKEHWGIAIGIINGIFGLGHMLGISLSGILLTLAFRFYSGDPGTTPDPGDTKAFVGSMNVTYLFALGISLVPLLTSLKRKRRFDRCSKHAGLIAALPVDDVFQRLAFQVDAPGFHRII